jgi:hypothetical protein
MQFPFNFNHPTIFHHIGCDFPELDRGRNSTHTFDEKIEQLTILTMMKSLLQSRVDMSRDINACHPQ